MNKIIKERLYLKVNNAIDSLESEILMVPYLS